MKVLLDNSRFVGLLVTQDAIQAGHPALYDALTWIAAPVSLFLLALVIIRSLDWVGWLHWLFPEPAAFLIVDLDAERLLPTEMIGGLLLPFVGRERDLVALGELFDKADRDPFRWRQVTAPSGVGKSRLALEWLAEAERLGWDMGLIDPKDSELLRGWTARKSTALVLDEAETQWSGKLDVALQRLRDGASAKHPVRVLVLGQFASYNERAAPGGLSESEVRPAMRLQLLDDLAIANLTIEYGQSERSELIAAESAGRPMAVALLLSVECSGSLADALDQWAGHLIPHLRSEGEKVDADLALGICLGALAGPVPLTLAEGLNPNFSSIPLRRFYSANRIDLLQSEIPELRPRDLAKTLAMKLIPHLPNTRRNAMIEQLLSGYPERIEDFLGEIWSDLSHFGQNSPCKLRAPDTLLAMQSCFDISCVDRVAASRQVVEQAANELSKSEDLRQLRTISEKVIAACSQRPFDNDIRLIEAIACVNGMYSFGKLCLDDPQAFRDFEQWGTRLISLVADRELGRNREIRLQEAKAAVNAAHCYGQAGKRDDEGVLARLEAWGDRLRALASDRHLGRDREIRLMEAKAAVNAIRCYGEAGSQGAEGAFAHLEDWGEQLRALAADHELGRDRGIRLMEAKAAAYAIHFYGEAGVQGDGDAFASLEAWGDRLTVVATDRDHGRDREIRLEEARAAETAVFHYGKAGAQGDAAAFARLEAWGDRLAALAADHELGQDREIRLFEARAAVHASCPYGKAGEQGDAAAFAHLEAWGCRLAALAADRELGRDREIRLQEAKVAQEAITHYGKAGARGNAAAFAHLVAWGDRLTALAADRDLGRDREIRLEEAKAAAKAICGYGNAGEQGDAAAFARLEAWGDRFDALVADPELGRDREIRLQEAKAAEDAIRHYGNAGKQGDKAAFAHLEAWGERLTALLADRERGRDGEIRYEEVKAAVNAILAYAQAGMQDHGAERQWRKRLALSAQMFRWDLAIQSEARKVDLAWSDQEKRNWRYGRVDPFPLQTSRPLQELKPTQSMNYRPIWRGPLWYEDGFVASDIFCAQSKVN